MRISVCRNNVYVRVQFTHIILHLREAICSVAGHGLILLALEEVNILPGTVLMSL